MQKLIRPSEFRNTLENLKREIRRKATDLDVKI